ncbi:hypothetical protein FRB97_008597 [Tulasnella sp. 331]|nr:hypothetical protein FRB97_008597 [Tulasnella sp. 331]
MSSSVNARLPETPLNFRRRVAAVPSTIGTTSSDSIDSTPFTPFSVYSRAASSAFVTPVQGDDASSKRVSDPSSSSSTRQKPTRTSIADISANWRTKARIAGIRVSSDSDSAAERPLLRSPAFISNDRRLARNVGRPDLFNEPLSMMPLPSRKSKFFLTPSRSNGEDALSVINDDEDSSSNFEDVFTDIAQRDRATANNNFFIRMDQESQPRPQRLQPILKSPRQRSLPSPKSTLSSPHVHAGCMGCGSHLPVSVFDPCRHTICHPCFTGIMNIADQKRLECPVCFTPVIDFTPPPAPDSAAPVPAERPVSSSESTSTKPVASPQDLRRWSMSAYRASSLAPSPSNGLSPRVGAGARPEPSVIRIDNLPWDVTPFMLASWLDLPFIHIHILLDRNTGKTLSHCLVELSLTHARTALRTCQNKLIGDGRRRRAVSVTMSGQAELMREVFPMWRGSFDGTRPSVQGLDQRRLADTIAVGLLTGMELDALMKLVETPNSHFLKVPTLPYHALISILQKFPAALDSRVFWTNALRDRLFSIVQGAVQVLSARVTQEGWDVPLMDELVSAGVSCLAFTDVQRRLISVAALPDTITATNTSFNTPSTPYAELDSDAASSSDYEIDGSPPNISEAVTPAEHINDLQTEYSTINNASSSSTRPSRRSSLSASTGVRRQYSPAYVILSPTSRDTRNMDGVHEVPFLPELLLQIFHYLRDPDSLLSLDDIDSAGLVCKAWRGPALAVKWRYAEFRSLMSVAAPLRRSNDLKWFPELSTLALHGATLVNKAVGKAVSRMKNLRIIDLPDMPLTQEVVQPLSKLQNLEIVRVGSRPEVIGDVGTGLIYPGSFPRLLELCGHFTFDHTTGPLLDNIASTQSLKVLEMTHGEASRTKSLANLELISHAIASHVLLRQLALHRVLTDTASTSVLKTLGSCSALEVLEIDLEASSVHITDDDVERLAKHLPNLEHLSLCFEAGRTPPLTLRSLIAALHHCPRLKYVGLWADACSAKLPTMSLPFHNVPFTLNVVMRSDWRILCPIDSVQAVTRDSSPHSTSEKTAVASTPASVTSDSPPEKFTSAPPPHDPVMEEKLSKLKRLLATSTAFSSIIAERIKTQKQQRAAALTQAEEDAEIAQVKNANGKRGPKSKATSGGSTSKRVKVEGGALHAPETEEDSKRVKMNEEILYMKQPESVTGATLRDYQLAGVQWLTLLYENGLNGILADEMGLGKTLQTIAFLAHLKEKGVWGPFLIVCPLSVLHNWAAEFAKFTPNIPVCIYHGTPEERKLIAQTQMSLPVDLNSSAASSPTSSRARTPSGGRRKSKGPAKKPTTRMIALEASAGGVQTKKTFPVVLTTYEMIIKDRNVLQKYDWSFVIIDEGHRLKNMESRLVQEIRTYPSANRLIITGTPLHNNLNELWSLLNFIMPKIFDDLSAFQAWFDPVAASSGAGGGLSSDQNGQLITSLHAILKPFLLRRLKVDVESNLPPKKEYVLYAPLTLQQIELYQSVVKGGATLRQWIVRKLTGVEGELDWETKKALEDKRAKDGIEKDEDVWDDEGIAQGVARRKVAGDRVNYAEIQDDDEWLENAENREEEIKQRKSGRSRKEQTADEIGREYAIKKAFQIVNNMHLQNKVMQLRKVCSHPYLFSWPSNAHQPKQNTPAQDLINASGKMLLLNRLLDTLFARGHKVLIFSQFTSMLDIIEEWAEDLKGWRVFRIDGSTKHEDRRDQMKEFNEAGESKDACRLFLLSTRAGGLGINLIAADTVIFYDSDWNPQMDLQAQDRAHRIGQTRPVLIFRLVSAHTIETQVLERASQKRKLEALVIAKGKFKAVGSRVNDPNIESLASSLLSLEAEKIDVVTSTDDKIISDADLDVLLDRRPEVFKERGVGWGKSQEGAEKEKKHTAAAPVTFKVFERSADELNDGLATMLDDDE